MNKSICLLMSFILFFLCFLSNTFWSVVDCQAAIEIVINKEQKNKVQLAIIPFYCEDYKLDDDDKLSSVLKDILISDLTRSGYFFCHTYSSNVEWLNEKEEKFSKIDLLFKGSYSIEGDMVLNIKGAVYDLITRKKVFNERLVGSVVSPRIVIHRLVNKIVDKLTGEKGIALTKIAYISDEGGEKQLYFMDYDGKNVIKANTDQGLQLSPNWSPKGDEILYTSYSKFRSNICLYRLSTKDKINLFSYPGLNASATFSPNGKDILLTLSKDGDPELYKSQLNGLKLRRLTNNRVIDISPTWSPCGRKMAFVSDRGGTPQIYTSDVSGKKIKRATYYGDYNTSPSWSPKGDEIAYTSRIDGVHQLCLLNLEDGSVLQLTKGRSNKEDPSWAPDGRHIVYSMTKNYKSDIYIMDIYFRENYKITEGKANYTDPAWSQ